MISDVNHRGIQQRLAVGAAGHSQCGHAGGFDPRQVAVGQLVGDLPAKGQAVGLHAGAGQEDHGVAVADGAGDAAVLGPDPPHRRPGQDDRLQVDDPAQGRRLPAAPDRPGQPAPLGEAGRQFLRPARVGEPGRVPHRRVHRDRNRHRPGGHQVVDDRRHGVDADVAVEAPPGQLQHRVGDQVLRPQPLLDVGEIFVGRLDQVRAFAADARRLGQPVCGQCGRRRPPPRAGRPA